MNEQQTVEWRKERLGRITASRFADVLGTPTAQATYARKLRAEFEILKRLNAGEDVPLEPDFYSAATEWGKRHEPIARAEYEWRNDVIVVVPQFRVHPVYPFVGCSADGYGAIETPRTVELISTNIGVEIKSPYSSEVHARTLVCGVPDEHVPQIQGEAWVWGFEAVDFVSFDPRRSGDSRYFERRIPRDEKFIKRLEVAVLKFWDFVQSGKDFPEGVAPTGATPVFF